MKHRQSWQLAALTLCAVTAQADEVLLKNGDKISGTVINKSGSVLELKTAYADKVVIKWDAVQTLKSDKPLTVVLKDKQELIGNAETAADGSVIVKSNGVYNTQPIPLDNIAEINKKYFSGGINVGGGLSDGNTTRQSYHGDADVVLRGRDDKVNFGGQYNYADNKDTDTGKNTLNARNWQLFGTYGHFFTDKWYGYANGLFTNDRMQDIQLRSAFGVGAGYEFFRSEELNLSVEAGPSYVSTNFYDTAHGCEAKRAKGDTHACDKLEDDSGIAARWAVNYDQFIFNKTVQIFHKHYGLFDSNLFIATRTGFHVPIWRGLQFTNEVQVDYYNGYKPEQNKQNVDTRYMFTVGYGW
ncbi:MAG: DUF481 domain-containing protein [Methylococcales bacterium]